MGAMQASILIQCRFCFESFRVRPFCDRSSSLSLLCLSGLIGCISSSSFILFVDVPANLFFFYFWLCRVTVARGLLNKFDGRVHGIIFVDWYPGMEMNLRTGN